MEVADALLQVQEVSSGYRWGLTYNLSRLTSNISTPLQVLISLRKSQPSQPQPISTYGTYGASRIQQETRKPALDGQVLENVLGHVMDSHLDEYGQVIVTLVIAETAIMDPQDYEHTILPFLKGIITRLVDGKDEIAMYKDLFQTCLSQ